MKNPPLTRNVIVIALGLPYTWCADYEMQTAKYLSNHNNVIVCRTHDGIAFFRWIFAPFALLKKIEKYYIFTPIYLLPFQRFAFIKRINYFFNTCILQFIIERKSAWKNTHKIFWTFSLQHSIYPHWFRNVYLKIYDCVDAFMTGDNQNIVYWQKIEQRIINGSDVILTNSKTLFDRHAKANSNVFQTPEGMFDPQQFAYSHQSMPYELHSISRPYVLFAGNINARLDFDLINDVVDMTPTVSYLFIGPIDFNYQSTMNTAMQSKLKALQRKKNVFFLGKKSKNDIPNYLRYSDLTWIPYDIHQEFVKMSYPMKLQEYFYAGKPVLSSAMIEIKKYIPLVHVYTSPKNAADQILNIVSKRWPKSYIARQKMIAKENSIEKKMTVVKTILNTHFYNFF